MIQLPSSYTEIINIYDDQGNGLYLDVPAGILTGEAWMRDPSCDVAFCINNTPDINQDVVNAWTNVPGKIRIAWLFSTTQYWVYSMLGFSEEKQILMVASPIGSPSLYPPVAASADVPNLQEVSLEGATTDQVLNLNAGLSTSDDQIHIRLNSSSAGFILRTDQESYAVIVNENQTDKTYTLPTYSGHIRVGPNAKRYVALITQSGTSVPTEAILENTFNQTPVYSRVSTGIYRMTVGSALFLSTKSVWVNPSYYVGSTMIVGVIKRISDTVLEIRVTDIDGTLTDLGGTVPIQVTIYP